MRVHCFCIFCAKTEASRFWLSLLVSTMQTPITSRGHYSFLIKFYPEQLFVLLSTKRMQLGNHADTQIVKHSQR